MIFITLSASNTSRLYQNVHIIYTSTRPEWSRPRSQDAGAKWKTRGGPHRRSRVWRFSDQIGVGEVATKRNQAASARERSHLPACPPSLPPHPGDAAAPRPSNPTARGTGRARRCRRRSAAMRRPPSSASSAPPPPSSSHVRSPSPSPPFPFARSSGSLPKAAVFP